MLVGHPQGAHRGGPDPHLGAVQVHALAQALGPELPVPVGQVVETIRIGQHHRDAAASQPAQVVQDRAQVGGVAHQLRAGGPGGHGRGPAREAVHVDAQQGGGQESHGGQHREAAAHPVGHREAGQAVLVGDPAQGAFGSVGGHQHSFAIPRLPRAGAQPFPKNQEAGHGLGRVPTLGDHVHQRLARVQGLQQGPHSLRVDVVQDVQARLFLGPAIGGAQRGVQGDQAQGRAADAQDHQVGEASFQAAGAGLQLASVLSRQIVEGQRARGAPLRQPRVQGAHLGSVAGRGLQAEWPVSSG